MSPSGGGFSTDLGVSSNYSNELFEGRVEKGSNSIAKRIGSVVPKPLVKHRIKRDGVGCVSEPPRNSLVRRKGSGLKFPHRNKD